MQGEVKVTANGLDGHTCSVIRFGTLLADQLVDVICFASTGNPSDTRFTLTYANHADLAGNQALPFGYGWDTQPTLPVYFPPINFAYSNGVAAGPITRLGLGRWSVTLPRTQSVIVVATCRSVLALLARQTAARSRAGTPTASARRWSTSGVRMLKAAPRTSRSS